MSARRDGQIDWEIHVDEAFAENVEFFRADGMTDEQIAARMGLTKNTFQNKLKRINLRRTS